MSEDRGSVGSDSYPDGGYVYEVVLSPTKSSTLLGYGRTRSWTTHRTVRVFLSSLLLTEDEKKETDLWEREGGVPGGP